VVSVSTSNHNLSFSKPTLPLVDLITAHRLSDYEYRPQRVLARLYALGGEEERFGRSRSQRYYCSAVLAGAFTKGL
jgi:hypothetical protein